MNVTVRFELRYVDQVLHQHLYIQISHILACDEGAGCLRAQLIWDNAVGGAEHGGYRLMVENNRT
jgi:hypothetical protein